MTDDTDAAWLPTDAYDAWQPGSTAERWAALARAWLDNPRLVSAIGGRIGDKPVNALSPDLARSWLAALRADVLAELDGLPEGRCPRRRAPARPRSSSGCAGAGHAGSALRLDQVGPTARRGRAARHHRAGRRSPPSAALLVAGEDPAETLDDLLPTPVDHVLLQADLTAIAPGPLEQELARKLALVADVESRGGATVYRFAASSVRRAFDAGWSATEVHDFVSSTSRTPVPQSLTYLVDDVSRRFGTLRAGHAESFLRSDDETALTELMHATGADVAAAAPDRADRGGLRRAPRHPAPPHPRARPGPRGRGGRRHRPGGPPRRVPRPLARVVVRRQESGVRAVARTAAVVSAIRAGDRSSAARPVRGATASTPADVIAMLRQAAESHEQLRIGYVGNDGTVAERLVSPERVEGGRVTAYDERSDSSRTFAIHRITAVSRPA